VIIYIDCCHLLKTATYQLLPVAACFTGSPCRTGQLFGEVSAGDRQLCEWEGECAGETCRDEADVQRSETELQQSERRDRAETTAATAAHIGWPSCKGTVGDGSTSQYDCRRIVIFQGNSLSFKSITHSQKLMSIVLVTADQARDSRQDSQINQGSVQEFC